MGAKMLPLLAAVDGTVYRVKFNNALGNSVTIKAADGWTYHYIHVNNDRPGTDDGQATRAQAFPSNIVVGATVTKGQVVAYLGDSGNAESAGSHLHFEIRQPAAPGTYQGVPINPYASLQAATRLQRVTAKWYLRAAASAGPSHLLRSPTAPRPATGPSCATGTATASRRARHRTALASGSCARASQSRPCSARSRSARLADTPLCADLDGDGNDEPVLFRAGAWTRAGWLRGRRTTVLDRPATAPPATVPSSATGTATAPPTSACTAGNVWYLRTTGAARPAATVHRFALRPHDRRRRSRPTGTVTATTSPACSAPARGTSEGHRRGRHRQAFRASATGRPATSRSPGRFAPAPTTEHRRLSTGPMTVAQRRSRSLAMWVIWISSVPA